MTSKRYLQWILIIGFFLISAGGYLLHTRIHPPSDNPANWIPALAGLISVLVLPAMFAFQRTLAWAYVINGMLAIIGTITMAHFSWAHLPEPITFQALLLNTTLADILILWTKFMLGQAMFELNILKSDQDRMRQGRFWRYPNMGWWWVHFLGLTIVYILGHQLWR